MIAFKDELMSFRAFSTETITTLDKVFKKCPVCGRERQIADPNEYLLKVRVGGALVFFDRESCKRRYLAEHPELTQKPIPGQSLARMARCREIRSKMAKEYIKLYQTGLTYVEIGKLYGKTPSAIRATVERYREDCEMAVSV